MKALTVTLTCSGFLDSGSAVLTTCNTSSSRGQSDRVRANNQYVIYTPTVQEACTFTTAFKHCCESAVQTDTLLLCCAEGHLLCCAVLQVSIAG
jgi:hypothetical protein